MLRVGGLTDEQVTAWEAQLERAVVDGLQLVMDKMAARILRNAPVVADAYALTAADENPPPMTAELAIPAPTPVPAEIPPAPPGAIPGQPFVSPDDLATIPAMWSQVAAETVLPLIAQVFVDSAGTVRSQLLESVPTVGLLAVPGTGSLIAEQYLAQAANTYEQVGAHLWATARTQLSEGFEAGESIDELAARLRRSAGLASRTAVLVARTSTIEASNAGSIAMARLSELEMEKEWIATPDLRTRESHLAADGQRVPLGDKFLLITGWSADFPADPSLPPSERYRCRCTLGYVMPDRPKALPPSTIDQALPGTPPAELEAAPETLAKEAGPGGVPLVPAFGTQAPSYVRPSLVAARTPEQLRDVWQAEMRAITGRDIEVERLPPDISPATAREYAEGVLQMLEQFPEARLQKINWFDAVDSAYAHVTSGSKTISFNERWASEDARRELLAQLKSDVATRFSVAGATMPQATVYHEFIHILDIETLGRVAQGKILVAVERRSMVEGLAPDKMIERDISRYAGSNLSELIAEAGTDVMINGQAASALSREIWEILRAEYRARGFDIRQAPALPDDLPPFGIEDFPKVVGWRPGGWASASLDKAREQVAEREFETYVRNQEQFGLAVDETYGRTLGRGIARQELPDGARAYQNGPLTIIVRDPANVDDQVLRAMQNQMDALTEISPLDGRSFTVRLGGRDSTGSSAAMAGQDALSLFGELAMAPRGSASLRSRFLMPSSAEQPKSVYDLTHEYGHSHMMQSPARSAGARELYDELDLKRRGDEGRILPHREGGAESGDTLGYYGAEDYLEAYAEAFAEWHLSAGLTQNPMVLRYVEKFGWRNPLEDFPKVAGPKIAAQMTVAELRAELKARGVTPPTGARKADLVRLVDEDATPTSAPAPVAAVRAVGTPAYRTATADLRAAMARPEVPDRSRRQTGQNAYVTEVERDGGPNTIRKEFGRLGETRAAMVRSADAEELGSLVADAVGVRAPAIVRTAPGAIEQELIEGTLGEEITGVFGEPSRDLLEGDGGRLLGLLDLLIGQGDRNTGNWIYLGGGRLAAIDHESAFQAGRLAGSASPFARALLGGERWPKTLDIDPRDLAVIRPRLEALAPEFERLGRAAWHKQVMARLAEVEKRATGAVARLPEALTFQPAAVDAAVARQATINSIRAVSDTLSEVGQLLGDEASATLLSARAAAIASRATGDAKTALAALVRAMKTGDSAKIKRAVTAAERKAGLRQTGSAGEVVDFDRTAHVSIGGESIPVGARVRIVRPGYDTTLPDGEDLRLSRAQVEPLTAEEIRDLEKRAQRAAARTRQKLLAEKEGTARLLAEVDELLQKGAEERVILQRLDPALAGPDGPFPNADLAVVEALRSALESGGVKKLRTAVTSGTRRVGLTAQSKAGAKVKFDPDTMDALPGVDIADGAPVVVVTRGTSITLPDGAVVQLVKARVTPERVAAPKRGVGPPSARTPGADILQDHAGAGEWVGELKDQRSWDDYHDRVMTGAVARQAGWGAPGRVVTKAEVDKAIQAGWTEIWRGVRAESFVRGAPTARGIARATQTGDWEMGHGMYGNGIYTTIRRTTAEQYRNSDFTATNFHVGPEWGPAPKYEWLPGFETTEEGRGGLLRMALDPQARIIDREDLLIEHAEYTRSPEFLALPSTDPWKRTVASDPNFYAVMRGYDGIRIGPADGHNDGAYYPPGIANKSEADQYIIFNRSVLIFERLSSRYDT